MECWAQDQATYLQIFFSSIGLEELDRDAVQRFLERERLVRFLSDDRYAAGQRVSDASGNRMWELNVVIGDEEEKYAESDVALRPHPHREREH
jgi:hypothetical protein